MEVMTLYLPLQKCESDLYQYYNEPSTIYSIPVDLH